LAAQQQEFRSAYYRLASPTAVERDAAIAELVGLEGDIGALARAAFKNARVAQRCALFEVFELRGDNGLLAEAAQTLADGEAEGADPRPTEAARSYVLSLPEDRLVLDTAGLKPAAAAAWRSILQQWLRLQIAETLVDSLLKPGKYLGQFECLRRRDAGALDAELVALIELEPGYLAALEDGAQRRHRHGIEAERLFSSAWRRLGSALGNFEPALALLRGEAEELPPSGRDSVLAAVELLYDMRTAAVRALAHSRDNPGLVSMLRLWHRALVDYEPPTHLRSSLGIETMRTELELTLARQGDRELLDARLAALRSQVERHRQTSVQVNARLTNRPDISARNEAAHLLLRSGDYAAAETEWLGLARDVGEVERQLRDSQRTAVATFLGAVYYNLACAQALQLKLTRAGQSLETAVAFGYRDFAWMLEDGDLESLRAEPGFREWFGRHAPPALVDRLPAGR
jgi:hypothetical protein